MTRAAATLLAASLSAPALSAPDRPFVDAAVIVPGLAVEMRYAGSHNFVGRPIAGYEAARCLLTAPTAIALRKAQDALGRAGFGLKVFDCYRPLRAVADFVAWAQDPADSGTKAPFYPDLRKADLFRLGYIARTSAHSRGSTVDLTLVRAASRGVDMGTPREVDMGTPFDFFGPASAPGSPLATPAQATNRRRLRAAMIRAGFRPYKQEWWHFTLAREPYPATAFDLPVR